MYAKVGYHEMFHGNQIDELFRANEVVEGYMEFVEIKNSDLGLGMVV